MIHSVRESFTVLDVCITYFTYGIQKLPQTSSRGSRASMRATRITDVYVCLRIDLLMMADLLFRSTERDPPHVSEKISKSALKSNETLMITIRKNYPRRNNF